MVRLPRSTGYCTYCTRRILLTTQGRLFLHSISQNWQDQTGRPVRCQDSMTNDYKSEPPRPRKASA